MDTPLSYMKYLPQPPPLMKSQNLGGPPTGMTEIFFHILVIIYPHKKYVVVTFNIIKSWKEFVPSTILSKL